VLAKGVPEERAPLVHVWSRRGEVEPVPRAANPLAAELGIGPDDFVVMYSGNAGIAHQFGPFLEAADRLRDEPGIRFLYVGDGPRRTEIEAFARERSLPNLQSTSTTSPATACPSPSHWRTSTLPRCVPSSRASRCPRSCTARWPPSGRCCSLARLRLGDGAHGHRVGVRRRRGPGDRNRSRRAGRVDLARMVGGAGGALGDGPAGPGGVLGAVRAGAVLCGFRAGSGELVQSGPGARPTDCSGELSEPTPRRPYLGRARISFA
jgi:hypothetical protein